MNKKAFTLIETLIATILYSILFLVLIFLYNAYTKYTIEVKTWNKEKYIKNLIEGSDKLVCYKGRRNKTNTIEENEYCDNIRNTLFFITTLINIRDKKFYKTLFIKEEDGLRYLGITTNNDFTINKTMSNQIEKYSILTGNGFSNISIKLKGSPLPLNLIVIDKNFLN